MSESNDSDNNKTGNEEVEKTSSGSQKNIIMAMGVIIGILVVLLGYTFYKDKQNVPGVSDERQAVESLGTGSAAQNAETSSSLSTAGQTTGATFETTDGSTVPQAVEMVEKKADLYIVSYTFSEDPKSGEEFEVKIKIGNKGNAEADDFHWEWWATHAGKDCDGEISGLPAGDTKTVGCKFTYSSWSTYKTKAVVDSKNEIDESNESNNTSEKSVVPIHDVAKADLYVSDYAFNHPPKSGEPFSISISIMNKGDAATGPFFWEWWPTHANHACRAEIANLPAHGGQVVNCTYTYSSWSTYETKAVVDADNDVSESDETNNTYTQNVIPIH